MSKNALPITVIMGGWAIFSFLPDRTRNGNWTSVQPKYNFAQLTPLRFCRYLNYDDARLIASRILQRYVKVAVLFGP
jgi:hypothetical protein